MRRGSRIDTPPTRPAATGVYCSRFNFCASVFVRCGQTDGPPDAAARFTDSLMNKIDKLRKDMLTIYRAALDRVEGRRCVSRFLQQHPVQGDVSVVAIGKAACAMAHGALDVLDGRAVDGLVITKPGHLDPVLASDRRLTLLEGGHPLPDEGSLAAGRALTAFIAGRPARRRLLFLISGGASSIVELLQPGLELGDLRRANDWLLGSGLGIEEINQVRRRLSRIKGGGLLRFIEGRPFTGLYLSDVPGDDPAVIGSGLLAAARRKAGDALEERLPDWLHAMMAAREGGPPAGAGDLHIVATLTLAREAAAEAARGMGYAVNVSHAMINADAENCGRRLGLELLDAWPGVYVWGGEPSVVLPQRPGRGGRNQHLALAAATVMEGRDDVCLLSAGTDGTDGPGEDAGALVDGGTLGRARREGFDAVECLSRADSGSLLEAAGDLVQTGPTGTNVMDLIIGARL